MRYLGIDFGTKRVGIATSDDSGTMAFPLEVLDNTEDLLEKIAKIAENKKIEEIVVGESKDFSGKDNEVMGEIKFFVERLKEKLHLPIRFHPEFLTSAEAERLQGKNDMLDASAAALILKSYLERKK